MKQAALSQPFILDSSQTGIQRYLLIFFAGLLVPLGFAPFHLPGLTLLSLAVFFSTLLDNQGNYKSSFFFGLCYGLGFFGLGISWVIISIHDYGQLNYFFSGIATFGFILYLSLFPAFVAFSFSTLRINSKPHLLIIVFAALWCLSEFARSNLMTGFPWLLIGTSQIDTPLRSIAPILGIYGLSFFCALAGGFIALVVREKAFKRCYYLIVFLLIILGPLALKDISWTDIKNEPIGVGGIQGNLSMRDKWDEDLFWSLLKYYEKATEKLLGSRKLIILPESAIPLPARYLEEYLDNLNEKALKNNSAIMLGILQPTNDNEVNYYNSIITLGKATGYYIKKQLVPFGEYIPKPFIKINSLLGLPEPNMLPSYNKSSIKVFNHLVASLICYEIAYPQWLRQQMPESEWIVSISDNGWFGRSLASYQQLQISQLLSLITGRFQVVVNNDGLSSIINAKGDIITGLPPFSSGLLQGEIYPAKGATLWVILSDWPILIFCVVFLILIQIHQLLYKPLAGESKRGYS